MLGAMLLRPAEYTATTRWRREPARQARRLRRGARARVRRRGVRRQRGSTSAPASRAPKPMAMEGEHGKPQPVRGLAVSDAGLTLSSPAPTAPRGERFDLGFRIADRRGQTVRDFDVEHTKRMHVIVVRRDMTGFQHVHPTQRADGSWSVPVTLDDAGAYRVFADFSVDETRAHARRRPVGRRRRPRDAAPAAGRRASRSTASRSPRATTSASRSPATASPCAIQDYLGAKGHLVALREGDLAFLHVHPDERRLQFEADVPDRRPLPPVPAVQDRRRPPPHGRIHRGGDPMTPRSSSPSRA